MQKDINNLGGGLGERPMEPALGDDALGGTGGSSGGGTIAGGCIEVGITLPVSLRINMSCAAAIPPVDGYPTLLLPLRAMCEGFWS